MTLVITIALLTFLIVTAIAIARVRNLVVVVVLSGIFSLLMATLFFVMDAADVALTESAVGAGISTILFLATLRLVGRSEKVPSHTQILPLFVVLATGASLIYATFDMPAFGDPTAPVQTHVGPRYIQESPNEVGRIPNVVTSVLASYRGFDTMGEVVVVFTAGAAVVMLIGGKRKKKPAADPAPTGDGEA